MTVAPCEAIGPHESHKAAAAATSNWVA